MFDKSPLMMKGKRKMKWSKKKNFSEYECGKFQIKKYGDLFEIYYNDKYIGARYTLKEAKVVAENYNK